MLARVRSWLRAFFFRSRWEDEMEDEFRSHLASRVEEYEAGGMSRESAERRARLKFGNPDALKEECREAFGLYWVDALARDLRHALRTLRTSPSVTASIVFTLGLSIGANTAVYHVS